MFWKKVSYGDLAKNQTNVLIVKEACYMTDIINISRENAVQFDGTITVNGVGEIATVILLFVGVLK